MTAEPSPITRLVGVYDADGTMRGELAYFVGARLGRTHCSLCEITHGLVRQRSAWKQCRAGLPVPFDTYHRDDQPAVVRAAGGDAPFVVAETERGVVRLLGPEELSGCAGSIDRFATALGAAAERAGLAWRPSAPR
jgi:hypothetical protein